MTVQHADPATFLTQVENLVRSHREHELYYSQAPLEDAIALQQVSRTLMALAGHRRTAAPAAVQHANPYAGCDDLNVQAAVETLGVLFLEGEGEPAEIGRIKREVATLAGDHERTGVWLGVRADLADKRLALRYLYAAAELIGRAADLLVGGAVLVHDSERRWRVFHERVETIRAHAGAPDGGGA